MVTYLVLGLILLFISGALLLGLAKSRKTMQERKRGHANLATARERLARRRELMVNEEILNSIKMQFEIDRRSHNPRASFSKISSTKVTTSSLWLSLINRSPYEVRVVRIDWQIWLGQFAKKASCHRCNLRIHNHHAHRDYCVDDILTTDDLRLLAEQGNSEDLKCFAEGKVYCQTKFGSFEKMFTLFDLNFLISGIEFDDDEFKVDSALQKDGLTGLYPRRYLDDHLQKMINVCIPRAAISFIMIDIDNFKAINDEYGHLVGDEVIRMTAEQIKSSIGNKGDAIRYGGDEFCVVLQECDKDEAEYFAEKIHSRIAQQKIPLQHDVEHPKGGPEEISVSVSLGVATLREPAGYKVLIKRADDMLLLSKKGGKNRVMIDRRG